MHVETMDSGGQAAQVRGEQGTVRGCGDGNGAEHGTGPGRLSGTNFDNRRLRVRKAETRRQGNEVHDPDFFHEVSPFMGQGMGRHPVGRFLRASTPRTRRRIELAAAWSGSESDRSLTA
jgi:hypothetical protein